MIILASTSKYRKAQLQSLGILFECISPDLNEDAVKLENIDTKTKAEKLALLKAEAVRAKYPNAIIIAGDQIASIDEMILSKPLTKENNLAQLQKLQGKTHYLYTSNVILIDGKAITHTEITKLTMKAFTDAQLKGYIDFAEPMDCAGGYKIELGGIALFDKIETNDFNSIQGMNLVFIAKELGNHIWKS
ncbi:MAG: septum formation protein Maf [Bdellovibrionales bacterium]|nr:septum formation protein Maf [Bdellovibrionales bacterium]